MKGVFRSITETLARKTSRRGLFGQGATIATGALLGVAAGRLTRPEGAVAGGLTVCAPPGPFCFCHHCLESGVCAKPCVINSTWYASGCWVTAGVTCCDCTCPPLPEGRGICGCTTDYHHNNCP